MGKVAIYILFAFSSLLKYIFPYEMAFYKNPIM